MGGALEIEPVHLRVQAPSWVDVDVLEVYVDGSLVESITLDGAEDATRFEGDVSVPIAPSGSFVVFHAAGDLPLDPVHPEKEPFGVTNPIFFTR